MGSAIGAGAKTKSRRRLRVPASWKSCCGARGAPAEGPAPASVQALALGDVARRAARLALHGGGGLALALLGRLLVVLALAGFGQHAGLLAGALEAAQGKLERLVFADFDAGHRNLCGLEAPAGKALGPREGPRMPPDSLRRAAYDSGTPRGGATAGPVPGRSQCLVSDPGPRASAFAPSGRHSR